MDNALRETQDDQAFYGPPAFRDSRHTVTPSRLKSGDSPEVTNPGSRFYAIPPSQRRPRLPVRHSAVQPLPLPVDVPDKILTASKQRHEIRQRLANEAGSLSPSRNRSNMIRPSRLVEDNGATGNHHPSPFEPAPPFLTRPGHQWR